MIETNQIWHHIEFELGKKGEIPVYLRDKEWGQF